MTPGSVFDFSHPSEFFSSNKVGQIRNCCAVHQTVNGPHLIDENCRAELLYGFKSVPKDSPYFVIAAAKRGDEIRMIVSMKVDLARVEIDFPNSYTLVFKHYALTDLA